MKLDPRRLRPHDARLYLQLGELIASASEPDFAGHMLRFVDGLVPVHRLDLSEWTIDSRQGCVERTRMLGSAGASDALSSATPTGLALLQDIVQMKDPLLIQHKRSQRKGSAHQHLHQCKLVSRSGDRRWVIGFHRSPNQRAFSLTELSLLKRLADTLLPLLEYHAQRLTPGADEDSDSADLLRQGFDERLAQEAVQLSSREQQVCLGLLTGGTVPEMAQRLNVKNSSVETYLKRATAKLGVSGRHGLARWMAGA